MSVAFNIVSRLLEYADTSENLNIKELVKELQSNLHEMCVQKTLSECADPCYHKNGDCVFTPGNIDDLNTDIIQRIIDLAVSEECQLVVVKIRKAYTNDNREMLDLFHTLQPLLKEDRNNLDEKYLVEVYIPRNVLSKIQSFESFLITHNMCHNIKIDANQPKTDRLRRILSHDVSMDLPHTYQKYTTFAFNANFKYLRTAHLTQFTLLKKFDSQNLCTQIQKVLSEYFQSNNLLFRILDCVDKTSRKYSENVTFMGCEVCKIQAPHPNKQWSSLSEDIISSKTI